MRCFCCGSLSPLRSVSTARSPSMCSHSALVLFLHVMSTWCGSLSPFYTGLFSSYSSRRVYLKCTDSTQPQTLLKLRHRKYSDPFTFPTLYSAADLIAYTMTSFAYPCIIDLYLFIFIISIICKIIFFFHTCSTWLQSGLWPGHWLFASGCCCTERWTVASVSGCVHAQAVFFSLYLAAFIFQYFNCGQCPLSPAT